VKEFEMPAKFIQALMLFGALVMSIPVQAQTSTNEPGYWHYGWGWSWSHMLFGSLMMVLFWGGLILVIVLAVRWFTRGEAPRQEPAPRGSALDTLSERFTRGEIDKEEFEGRKRLLTE
jgi:putative membrane protein